MAKKTDKASAPHTHTIRDLDQIKALAHPLRVRIVETLADSEGMTTKQVAEAIGEKPTRLYHHVDQLEKSGLIELTHTKQNRGTVEKYFRTIARQFRADPELFAGPSGNEAKDALRPIIETALSSTTSELLQLIDANPLTDSLEEDGLFSFVEMHLEQEQIDEVQRRLKEVLEFIEAQADDDAATESLRKYRLTLACYPLDRMDGEPSE